MRIMVDGALAQGVHAKDWLSRFSAGVDDRELCGDAADSQSPSALVGIAARASQSH